MNWRKTFEHQVCLSSYMNWRVINRRIMDAICINLFLWKEHWYTVFGSMESNMHVVNLTLVLITTPCDVPWRRIIHKVGQRYLTGSLSSIKIGKSVSKTGSSRPCARCWEKTESSECIQQISVFSMNGTKVYCKKL